MKEPLGCGRPTGGAVAEEPGRAEETTRVSTQGRTQARVGHAAPDFVAPAYAEGGFKKVRLSEYLGKWVVLCFYPGDFTFV